MNKFYRRSIFLVLAALLIASLAVACGAPAAEAPPAEEEPPAAEEEAPAGEEAAGVTSLDFVVWSYGIETIQDNINNRVVEVPPSVAALGALGFNDKTQQVWFAPAGFNRGALDFVTNAENRLSSNDRDDLYDWGLCC